MLDWIFENYVFVYFFFVSDGRMINGILGERAWGPLQENILIKLIIFSYK